MDVVARGAPFVRMNELGFVDASEITETNFEVGRQELTSRGGGNLC